MKRARLASDAEDKQDQSAIKARTATLNDAYLDVQSLNDLVIEEVLFPKKSMSSASSRVEPGMPGEDPMADLDLFALGLQIPPKSRIDQSLEGHEANNEQPETSRNGDMDFELPPKNSLVLFPQMADEVLILLDAMAIRLIRCEAKSSTLLRENEAGARKKISSATRLFSEMPRQGTRQSNEQLITEICGFVESVFGTYEGLTIKLLESQTKEMCEAVRDLNRNLRGIKTVSKLPPAKPRVKKSVSKTGVLALEIVCEVICLVLFFFAIYLFFNPLFGDVVTEFYANATGKNLTFNLE